MEKKLKALFEFQRFQNNAALAELIAETEGRDGRRLTEEDLSFVHAAAGDSKLEGKISKNKT